jgi:hypothetical protein
VTHDYFAYGLGIRSEVELLSLEPGRFETPDLTIKVTRSPRPAEPEDSSNFRHGEHEQVWQFANLGTYVIRGENEVLLDAYEGVTDQSIEIMLVGPIFAILLHRLGYFVIHGSAIEIDGKTAVFVGQKGAGKSTTGAALLARGHKLVNDDLAAVTFDAEGAAWLTPGFPQTKLSPQVVENVAIAEATILPKASADFNKELFRLTAPFSHEKRRISRIYVLHPAEEFAVEPLHGPAALPPLLEHSYVPQFTHWGRPFTLAERAEQLRACSKLIGAVQVCDLKVARDLSRFDALCETIEHDIAR